MPEITKASQYAKLSRSIPSKIKKRTASVIAIIAPITEAKLTYLSRRRPSIEVTRPPSSPTQAKTYLRSAKKNQYASVWITMQPFTEFIVIW